MAASSIVPIQRVIVGSGGVTSVEFNNIPQTFTDLRLVVSARDSGSSPYLGQYLLLNNLVAGGLYSTTSVNAYGAVNSSRTSSGDNTFPVPSTSGATATASVFGSAEIYIPQYKSSNFKQIMVTHVSENNSTSTFLYNISNSAVLVRTTAAITRIVYVGSNSIAEGSSLALYGILAN